ncbi:MAG: hypothetical protein LAP87_23720 [Acidobacteriia bacterium]|nr:hypothetical protein [Terriglobia bacterium]
MDSLPIQPVRQAVASGEFARAQRLWNEYAARFEAELARGAIGEARLAEMRELVEWSRTVVLCARAHLGDQLDSAHVAEEYGMPRVPAGPRIVQARF